MVTLAVGGISLLIVFFLYARTEALRREMLQVKKQLSSVSSERTALSDVVKALAFEQQVELRKQLTKARSSGYVDEGDLLKYTESMIECLLNVTVDSAKGDKNAIESLRKELLKKADITYADFCDFISTQDDRIKTEWHKKTVSAYLKICQLLIDTINGELGKRV